MRTVYFKDYNDLAYDMWSQYQRGKEKYDDVNLICKYDELKEIISALVKKGFPIAFAKIESFEIYDDEYMLAIFEDELWIEPMKRDGKYLWDDGHIMYVLSNCNSAVLKHVSGDEMYEVVVSEDEEEVEKYADTSDGDDDCESELSNKKHVNPS